MTESVVLGTFIVVGKNGVGLLNLFETLFGVFFSTPVGVILPCEAAKCVLQIPRRG